MFWCSLCHFCIGEEKASTLGHLWFLIHLAALTMMKNVTFLIWNPWSIINFRCANFQIQKKIPYSLNILYSLHFFITSNMRSHILNMFKLPCFFPLTCLCYHSISEVVQNHCQFQIFLGCKTNAIDEEDCSLNKNNSTKSHWWVVTIYSRK